MIKLKDLLEGIKVSKDTDTMTVDILDDTNKKIGDFALETYDNKHWTIVDANIDPSSRGKGYYYKSILQLLDKYPDMIIVSAFRSAEADRAWSALKQKMGTRYNITTRVVDGEKEYYLSKRYYMIKLKELLEKSFSGILYHGSDSKFNIQNINLPAHFGTKIAAKEIGGKYLYKAQINIKHPIRMYDDQIQVWDLDTVGGTLKSELKVSENEIETFRAKFGAEKGLVKLLHKYGYDGIVYENQYEDVGNDSYIVFYKSQIKL